MKYFSCNCTKRKHIELCLCSPTTSLSSKQDSGTRKEFTSLHKERQEYSTKTDSDYGYGSTTRFRPIDKDVSGARAIRVQDIPNGAVGRPVEFESMHSIALLEWNAIFWRNNFSIFSQLMDRRRAQEIWRFWWMEVVLRHQFGHWVHNDSLPVLHHMNRECTPYKSPSMDQLFQVRNKCSCQLLQDLFSGREAS